LKLVERGLGEAEAAGKPRRAKRMRGGSGQAGKRFL